MSKKNKKKVSEYAQNLSHELLTPLAIIRSKAEILMQSPNLNGEDLENIDVILKNVRRINSLNKSLILLSKIEEKVYVDREQINIKELTDEILENFEDQIRSKKLSLRFKFDKVGQLLSNRTLIDILITNLIKNAVVHNTENGFIHISINEGHFAIENSFDNNFPPPVQHYKRFSSSRTEEGSIGLGLSIVKRISKYLEIPIHSEHSESTYKSSFTIS